MVELAALTALLGLMAYAVFGGADFGGGVWDLFARGPRREDQRRAITRAMGPVWEANHVWLIFVLVVLFTCFPRGYGAISIALFVPFHLALLGIMLRGASFVFRGYARTESARTGPLASRSDVTWGVVFGVASLISPFLLGASFGVVTAGAVMPTGESAHVGFLPHWLKPYSIGCGLLAISTCAYLAAVYLTVETDGELRNDFRRRAIIAGTTTAALAGVVLVLAWFQARWFIDQFFRPMVWPVITVGLILFGLSAWAVFARWYRLSRIFAAGQVIVLLLGWALAQYPYFAYPSLTFEDSAGPRQTIAFMLATLPVGAILLVPSLILLIRVFKSPMPETPTPKSPTPDGPTLEKPHQG